MASLTSVITFAALFSGCTAQVAIEHVWSSVAFVYHGERTPLQGPVLPVLTPLGAQQMFDLGSMFRARYVSTSQQDSPHGPIQGIATDGIDNSQLFIAADKTPYTAASAFALMQGLYPPHTRAFSNETGSLEAAELANGTVIDYPMDGYQYPDIEVPSLQDPDSIWTQGHSMCSQYQESSRRIGRDESASEVYERTLDFYQGLWNEFFTIAFPSEMANFYYAYELYDYAKYNYDHVNGSHSYISAADLATLEDLASVQQRYVNGHVRDSSTSSQDLLVLPIAGRTLAAKVIAQLRENVLTAGSSAKLSVLAGSFEPLVAFFGLSNLITGPAAEAFTPLPGPGAAVAFELFSSGDDNETVSSTDYPASDNLWVRFLYRNSSDSGGDGSAPLVEYPLFGNGNSQSRMSFQQFAAAMDNIAVESVLDWCNACGSAETFCTMFRDRPDYGLGSNSRGGGGGKVSPAAAGVIGAFVSLAVVGLVGAGAVLLGGLRFYRSKNARRGSALGGFKGAEKMNSDVDVAYGGSGARHDRTGSWELRGAGKKPPEGGVAAPDPAVVKESLGSAGGRSDREVGRDDDSDGDDKSVMGSTPVKPRESI